MRHADLLALPASEDFSPPLIFGCGQCFRFDPVPPNDPDDLDDPNDPDTPEAWRGVAFGKQLTVFSAPQGALLDCAAEEADCWHAFFDMDRDYAAVRQAVAIDDFMAAAAAFGRGIRILHQDFWEALCSFILSQCNNIPRIKRLIASLCAAYGAPIGRDAFAFPGAAVVARLSEAELRALGVGYRAPYVLAAARAVAEGRLHADTLRALPGDEAKRTLMRVEGVGEKVADCVLLYGLHRLDAFPVDTWMRRALAEYFPANFDPAVFGAHAGIAQQYIFHYVRHLHATGNA